MDSLEAEVLTNSERREDTAPSTPNTSGQEADGPRPKSMSLKRTTGNPSNTKAKKQKKARMSRPAQLGYTVQQGEDMLLVISSTTPQYDGSAWTLPKKGRKKRKLTKGKVKTVQIKKKKLVCVKPALENNPVASNNEDTSLFVPEKAPDHRWGQNLPEEVLINIFQMVVVQDGAVPFLCRVGRVCHLWNAAASSPVLWRKVSVGHCWIAPGKTQLPKTEKRIKDTLTWLAQNRFSQLQDFSLHHWTKNVSYAVESFSIVEMLVSFLPKLLFLLLFITALIGITYDMHMGFVVFAGKPVRVTTVLAQYCTHLHSLTLSYCSGLTASAFHSLGVHCRSLQSMNLQYSEFQVDGLLEYLENHGSQIKQILFTHGQKNDRLLTAITRGYCPDLELLEVNTKLDSKDCELPVCIQALQMACPKLKTFRMLNVRPLHKTMRNGADSTLGFPLLEELCIATTSYSYMTDKDLWDILFGSTRLRVLDLRGCSRITPSGLAALPCLELECLFWGHYFSSSIGLSSPKAGIHMVTQKWCQTLQQLDIANQLFTAEDLEMAMSHLAQATEADTLRSLNLSGTRITPPALRSVISQITALNYLNLSSCRYLPRGAKRIYRGQQDIRQLLDKLD